MTNEDLCVLSNDESLAKRIIDEFQSTKEFTFWMKNDEWPWVPIKKCGSLTSLNGAREEFMRDMIVANDAIVKAVNRINLPEESDFFQWGELEFGFTEAGADMNARAERIKNRWRYMAEEWWLCGCLENVAFWCDMNSDIPISNPVCYPIDGPNDPDPFDEIES